MQKEEGKKYQKNQLYFFAMSWYDPTIDVNINKSFELLFWSLKLNKLTFQCLAIRDRLIFPIRIINSEYLESPLSYVLNIKKQDFCGYFHTRFTDNYNCIEKFDEKCRDKFYFIYSNNEIVFITGSGKKYELFYYTGNSIWFDVSILPYYKIILCEINWIYYSFILKYKTIPHFYKYINENNELEIVVSKYTLNEIYNIYREKGYDELELKKIEEEVFYNHNYYKIINTTDKIFVKNPLLNTEEQKKEFIHKILRKIKI
jgi:hypothetical protein